MASVVGGAEICLNASLTDYKEIIKLHIKCNYPAWQTYSGIWVDLDWTGEEVECIEEPGLGRDKMK